MNDDETKNVIILGSSDDDDDEYYYGSESPSSPILTRSTYNPGISTFWQRPKPIVPKACDLWLDQVIHRPERWGHFNIYSPDSSRPKEWPKRVLTTEDGTAIDFGHLDPVVWNTGIRMPMFDPESAIAASAADTHVDPVCGKLVFALPCTKNLPVRHVDLTTRADLYREASKGWHEIYAKERETQIHSSSSQGDRVAGYDGVHGIDFVELADLYFVLLARVPSTDTFVLIC